VRYVRAGLLRAALHLPPALDCCHSAAAAINQQAPFSEQRGRPAAATRAHLLVAAQDVADRVGAGEGLVDLHGGAARVGKQRVHTLALQSLHMRNA
jgi:hypothetical protein